MSAYRTRVSAPPGQGHMCLGHCPAPSFQGQALARSKCIVNPCGMEIGVCPVSGEWQVGAEK